MFFALSFLFVLVLPTARSFPGSGRSLRRPGPALPPDHPPVPRQDGGYAYPYTGALPDLLPGPGLGGVPVPAPGDTAHEFQPPPPGAYRGPCPGLNAAANHGFISRNGITNLAEVVAGLQNMYNLGWDLAVFLAVLAIVNDGDIVTTRFSIGGDATALTSPTGILGGLLGTEGGLDAHNLFEQDASLTRNDYYLNNGDAYTFNGTLFAMMTETVASTSSQENPLYDFDGIALYRYQRYQQSLQTNPEFFFGPKELVLYGAASFLYSVFPNSANGSVPDHTTISSFFGASQSTTSPGGYAYVYEQLPPDWYNRVTPYGLADVVLELLALYLEYPVLFGGNAGVNNFDLLGNVFSGIEGGKLTAVTPAEVVCLLYQMVASQVPDSLSGVLELPQEVLNFALNQLNPIFGPLGCTLVTPS